MLLILSLTPCFAGFRPARASTGRFKVLKFGKTLYEVIITYLNFIKDFNRRTSEGEFIVDSIC